MRTLLITVLCIVLVGCQSPTPISQNPEPPDIVGGEGDGQDQTHTTNPTFIGVVESGKLRILSPKSALSGSTRFTSIGMQQAVSPETGELDLTQHEGNAIAIQGHGGGGWVYSAKVIDEGGPIVTVLVLQVFGR